MIDTHLHVWQRSVSRYRWLDDAPPALQTDHDLDQALAAVGAHGFEQAVLVQADETLEETAYLLGLVAAQPRLRGAVCYLPLEDPGTVARMLPRLVDDPGFVGIRNLTHDRPDPDWVLGVEQSRSIELIEQAGVPLDVVAVLPRHRDNLLTLAQRHPGLTLVLDHLGTPPVGETGGAHERWSDQIAAAASCPNVVAKISGIYGTGGPATPAHVEDLVATVLELFGPGRLMLGSDWPVCEARGGVEPTLSALVGAVAMLPPDQQRAVRTDNATRVYRLDRS